MLRANKSVIPPNFRISLHSTSTSILSPITPEPRRSLLTSYFLYGIKPFQSAARGPVPTRLHGNFHHPSPLFASGREVLLPVTTFLCLVKVITAIIRGGRISCQAFLGLFSSISRKNIFQVKICLLLALIFQLPFWIRIQIREIGIRRIAVTDPCDIRLLAVWKQHPVNALPSDDIDGFLRKRL